MTFFGPGPHRFYLVLCPGCHEVVADGLSAVVRRAEVRTLLAAGGLLEDLQPVAAEQAVVLGRQPVDDAGKQVGRNFTTNQNSMIG